MAGTMKREALIQIIKGALDKLPAETAPPAFVVNPATLPKFAGTYRDTGSGLTMTVTLENGTLMSQLQGQPAVRLVPSAENMFRVVEVNATLTFNERGGLVESIGLVQGPANLTLARVTPDAAAAAAAPPAACTAPRPQRPLLGQPAPRNWPAFRGDGAAGNGDGQRAVAEWDIASGKNIKWKTPIPGVATSSPVVWGDRVFAVTAISKAGDKTFKTGLYGDVKPVDDLSEHEWKIYASTRAPARSCGSAQLSPAYRRPSGTPRAVRPVRRRSLTASASLPSLASAGRAGRVGLQRQGAVASRSRSVLDSGWFFDPAFQWGHSSSPIIYRNSVILQADVQKGSYIAAWDLATGKQLWKTPRDRRDLHVGHADDRTHGRRPR